MSGIFINVGSAQRYGGRISSLSRTIVPALWTPAALGASLAAWLDGSDASTVTTSGTAITQWRDKSGNARHFSQAIATNQPAYSTSSSFANRTLPTFDGVDDWMDADGGWVPGFGSWYVVAHSVSDLQQAQTLFGAVGSTVDGFPFGTLGVISTNSMRFNNVNDPLASSAFVTGTTVKAKNAVNAYSRGNWFTAMRTPGIFEVVGVGPFGQQIRLGNFGLTGFRFFGPMAEIVHTSTESSTSERQVIEGYLAHKWGLQASLPTGHPFRNSPPYI